MQDSIGARLQRVDPTPSNNVGAAWNDTLAETLIDVLIECVKAAGGSKVVGNLLWRDKTVDQAARHLVNCLNENRPERLTPEQAALVGKLARAKGCHAYVRWLCRDLGYAEPVPVEPRDQADELRRQVLAMGEQLQAALAQLSRLGVQ